MIAVLRRLLHNARAAYPAWARPLYPRPFPPFWGKGSRAGWLPALCLAAGLAGVGSLSVAHVRAQSVSPGVVLYDLGDQSVSGTNWSFSGDFAVTAGAFESVTVSNYGYCFVGPNDPRAGTAHAAAVFWFTELKAMPPADGSFKY